MGSRRKQATPPFPVGARVWVRFGTSDVLGEVIEDRGPLAAGRQLLRVRLDVGEVAEPVEMEVPADEVRSAGEAA